MLNRRLYSAFTIIELLVVIVVIGVLAAITVVSYTGITQRATSVSIESDLANMSKQLKLFYAQDNLYPANNTCPVSSLNDICLKPSAGNNVLYTVSTNRKNFKVVISNSTNVMAIYGDSEIISGSGINAQTYYFRSDGILSTDLTGSSANNIISLSDYGGYFPADISVKVEKWDTTWTEISPQGSALWANFTNTTNTIYYDFPGAASSTNNLKIRITVYMTMAGATASKVFTTNDLGTKFLPSGVWGIVYNCLYVNDTDYGPLENELGTDVQFKFGGSTNSRITNFGGI